MNPVVFMLQIGSAVAITFSNEDISGTPITTLNVESTGAYNVICGGIPLKNGMIGKDYTHLFVFDGTNWRLINPVPGTGIPPIVIGPGKPPEDPADNDPSTPSTGSVINMMTGYHGITYSGPGATVNAQGETDKIWFTFQYTPRLNDVEFTISQKPNVWAAKMSDGSTVHLHNPVVKSVTRANAVVEFTAYESYSSDSPCILVYLRDTAWFLVTEI
jgi:hypothetical protein